jgi:hypothetical protein
LSRTGGTASPTTVRFGLSGSALANLDYFVRPLAGTSASRALTIPTGQTQARLCIVTTAGASNAGDAASETVVITLQPGAGYAVGSPSSTTMTITEDG